MTISHLKNQCSIRRYLWRAASWTIGIFWFTCNPTDFTNLHSGHSNVPCFDHLTCRSQMPITHKKHDQVKLIIITFSTQKLRQQKYRRICAHSHLRTSVFLAKTPLGATSSSFKSNQIWKFPRDPNLAQTFLPSRFNNSFHRLTEHRYQLKCLAQSQVWGSNNKVFRKEGLRVRDCLLLFWKQSKPTAFSFCTSSSGKEQHQW